jgi:hypothetical protein
LLDAVSRIILRSQASGQCPLTGLDVRDRALTTRIAGRCGFFTRRSHVATASVKLSSNSPFLRKGRLNTLECGLDPDNRAIILAGISGLGWP